ncbi:sigma-70 family RNA polymerase sigma factor [Streptomyces antibioticus]|uniref:sigma-70 family RNA polymerase sigma factor n=1 Tax=Streptomyces antibioticus TaxID=1890 RepID=UPI00225356BC|nr:sigma-70 family RNA polymerase sigma factor [Streptomyces antibioticus]MCX4742701.1 sigma-70 family RNA polymerase sigma factor [Streptomyces antibioticus]
MKTEDAEIIVSLPNNATAAPPGPEPELVARARTGDRDAFAALYHEHYRPVYAYLLVRTRDRHLAEDLTQEVFTRALRRIDAFTWQGTAFAAWLTTIAKNLYLDEIGRGRTRLETPVAEFQDPQAPGRDTESLALRELEAVEAHEAVRAALHALNDHQRHCVELRFLDELSAEETALAMGRSVGAVKTLTYRALRKMRWTAEAVCV